MEELETIENSILRDIESYQEEIEQLRDDLEETNDSYSVDIEDLESKIRQSQREADNADTTYKILYDHGVRENWPQEEVEEYILNFNNWQNHFSREKTRKKEYDATASISQKLGTWLKGSEPEITDEVKKAYYSYLRLNDEVYENSEHHLTDIEGAEWQGKMKKFRDAAEARDTEMDQFFDPDTAKDDKTYLNENTAEKKKLRIQIRKKNLKRLGAGSQ
jgi:hypothetical protein